MSYPEWVDGSGFYEWIDGQVADWRVQLSERQNRFMRRLLVEKGTKASLAPVDAICCRLGLHINEIPEDLWTTRPKTGGRNGTPKEVRQLILGEVQNGKPIRTVARRYGVSRSTIQVWRRSAA